MDPFWMIVIGVGGLIAAGALVGGWQQRKRAQAWQELGQRPGFQFLGNTSDVLHRCGDLRLFRAGRSRRFRNAVAVDAGDVRIEMGDYSYTTGSGKNSRTHHQTLCILHASRLDLPHCSLRPESRIFDTLGSWLGGQDIDFAEDPRFSAAYVLQGDSEPAIRQLFQPEVRAWFAERAGRNFHFEAQGDTLVFHTGRHLAPAAAPEHMDQALQIMKLLAAAQREAVANRRTNPQNPGAAGAE